MLNKRPARHLSFFIIAMFALLTIAGGIVLGSNDAKYLAQRQYEFVNATIAGIEKNHRHTLLMGELDSFLTDVESSMGLVNLKRIEIDHELAGPLTLRAPFARTEPSEILIRSCPPLDKFYWLSLPFVKCIRQNATFFFDLEGTRSYMHIYWLVDDSLRDVLLRRLVFSLLGSLVIAFLVGLIADWVISRYILAPLSQLSEELEKLASRLKKGEKAPLPLVPKTAAKEVYDLARSSRGQIERLFDLEEEMLKASVFEATAQMAQQVAHDIRSPLAALNVISNSAANLDDESRLMLRSAVHRVAAIAQDLMSQSQTQPGDASGELLAGVVETSVLEKRLEFSDRPKLTLMFEVKAEGYRAFARIERRELLRILSNLLNNAAEAANGCGEIVVSLSIIEANAVITVRDNGCGIAEDQLEKIFSRGFSANKDNGTGLGLYHAREIIARWGGRITVTSKLGDYTEFYLEIPTAVTPDWFCSELVLTNPSNVVLIDDDPSMEILVEQILRKNSPCDVIGTFRAIRSVEEFLGVYNELDHSRLVVLMDYHVRGSQMSGVEALRQVGMQVRRYLITSEYFDSQIQDDCIQLGIKILPKPVFSMVPIRIAPSNTDEIVVLVDDNIFVRQAWKLFFQASHKQFIGCASKMEFLQVLPSLEKGTPIFLDVELQGARGDELGEWLHQEGFTNLYLATGHDKIRFKHLTWVRAVLNKEPPEWLLH